VGPAALLSHLDTIRSLGRSFRRAGLSLKYSLGFHPKPEFTFGPALPVGIASLAEYLDVTIELPVDCEHASAQLQSALPTGFEVVSMRPKSPKENSIAKILGAPSCVVHYQVGLSDVDFPLENKLISDIEGQWWGGSLVTERVSHKGEHKMIDVRPALKSIVRATASVFEKASLCADHQWLFDVSLLANGATIADVVRAFAPDAKRFAAVRVRFEAVHL